MSEILLATIVGFASFAVAFALTLYGLTQRRPKAPPAPTQTPAPPAPSVEQTRIDLTREARKELTSAPPEPKVIVDSDLPSVVHELHQRATRASSKPGED